MPLLRKPRGGRTKGHHSDDDESTPICRCRVLYLGSAVPHITKDGLQGIQEPLKELYPDTGLSSLKGIDSWLSVWSNGLLLENVDEKNTKITRFFPIESLHYCAAVRNVLVPANRDGPSSSSHEKVQKFLPLDSPFAQLPNLNHPPLFACILRRTTGIKVLECHAFICKREMAANALVRCCFHAYADSTYAKQLENGGTLATNGGMTNGNGYTNGNGTIFKDDRPIQRSVTPLDSIEKVTGWQALSQNGDSDIIVVGNSTDDEFRDGPVTASTPSRDKFEFRAEFPDEDEIYEGDENHKIWSGNNSTLGHNGTSELVYLEPDGTLKSIKSHTSRLSRPRQFISPPPPPPPPPQQFSLLKAAEEDASSKKKMKKKLKKDKNNHQLHPQYLIRPASMMNLSSSQGLQPILTTRPGSVVNGPVSHRPGSAMSTMTRTRPHNSQQLIPVPHHGNGYLYPPQPIYGHLPPHFAISHPQLVKASKSKKKQKQLLTAVPILAPTPMPMMAHHPAHHSGHHPGLHSVPSPMNQTPSPMFHHHHQKMMMEDHERNRGMKGPSSEMLMSQPPAQYATIERGYHYHSRPMNGESATLMSNKSKGKSKDDEDREGSPFSSGIYRKKGHLNERAFSYSIRQEHRSRSYGSLANLQFANETGGPLRPSGSPPHTAEGMKKEREIIQMVRDLDLSGDEIERSHVPSDMYPQRRPPVNGYRKQNGHGPRITHR